MKSTSVLLGIMLFATAPVFASGDDVRISGSMEIQYRQSSDLYAGQGNDRIVPEQLFIQLEKGVAEDVSMLLKLDGADMDKGTASHKYVEEAQVIFKNVAARPLTLIFGKDEMPFGQDYERFLLSSKTHGFEIDKVWGMHGIYDIDGFGSVAAAFFERDPGTADTALTDSLTIRAKTGRLADNLSFEASYAVIGKDDSVPAETDETRLNIGAVFNLEGLTLHSEYTFFSDYGNTAGRDLGVLLAGADYRAGNLLFKVRHEESGDNQSGGESGRTAAGISYYFSENILAAAELEKISYEGSKADTDEFLLGVNLEF